ncbi:MAG: NAD(P)/FAD-dependent oxidoreductase [Actinomycetota bacterium]|nr:NAD(P)/FAD-dependent oxidoreductase [Actinomycetota bacterium]
MADRSVDFLLIGGGVAAARCARTLREEGAEGSIVLVGREPDPPYDRPHLSKGYLRGESGREDALAESSDWWEQKGIELLTRTSVMKLDSDNRTAKLSTKEEIGFDKALLATGANVRRLRAAGADLEGIHYLRAFANSDAIREEAAEAERVVLIGGSYIGCEVAASLTSCLGRQCTIVMQEDEVLERTVGPSLAPFFGSILREHGVKIHGGDSLDRFEGSDGRVSRVVTEGGLELDCDMVIVGAGVMPDVMLARSGGLELGEAGGLLCSSGLETSLEGVFAAGDMCEYDSVIHGRPLRVEHWDVAAEHGKTAARNMLGQGTDHEVVPYFFSDLADWVSLGYVGPGSGEPTVRGSVDDGSFTAFYLDDGRVTAALSVGRDEQELDEARRFIKEGARPDPSALADEGTELTSL